MNASLAGVLSEMKGSQFVEAHAVAEAEKLMESLSVGLSRVAQLARHAAESQMKVEISVRTPKGTARGDLDSDWTPAQQPDRRRPRITGKTAVDELETPVQGFQDANQGSLSESKPYVDIEIRSSVLMSEARCSRLQVLS